MKPRALPSPIVAVSQKARLRGQAIPQARRQGISGLLNRAAGPGVGGQGGLTLAVAAAFAIVLTTAGCSPTGNGENTARETERSSIRESPEEQFRRVRMSELGPNMKIGQIVMSVKRQNGDEVVYGGYYTLMFDERLGIVGNKPDTFFFHAFYRDGQFVGWTPDR
ncbi:MAG: hypothetical protein RJA22_2034 [Verrucomicrobiota bacterium]